MKISILIMWDTCHRQWELSVAEKEDFKMMISHNWWVNIAALFAKVLNVLFPETIDYLRDRKHLKKRSHFLNRTKWHSTSLIFLPISNTIRTKTRYWIWKISTLKFLDREILCLLSMINWVHQELWKQSKDRKSLKEKSTELPCKWRSSSQEWDKSECITKSD